MTAVVAAGAVVAGAVPVVGPAAARADDPPPVIASTAAGPMACPTASLCWEPGAAEPVNYLLKGVGNHRTVVPMPAYPGGTAQLNVRSVTCRSAKDCWAVGGQLVNWTAHWNGRAWRAVPAPTPRVTGLKVAQLNSVSCSSAVRCFAVGALYVAADSLRTEALTWNGRAWHVTPVLSPAAHAGKVAELTGVSCAADGCWAVGAWQSGHPHAWSDSTMAFRYAGGAWRSVAVPADDELQLPTISCVTAASCWIASSTVPTGSLAAANEVLHWDGHTWKRVAVPSPVGLKPVHTTNRLGWSGNILESISCVTARSCWAVGETYSNAAGGWRRAQVLHWDGVHWKVVAAPAAARAGDNYLRAVACSAQGSCWLTGEASDRAFGSAPVLFMAHWNGKRWVG